MGKNKNTSDERKLNIGMLSFYYPHLGGSGIVTSRLARYLAEDGHNVHFIGYDSDVHPPHMEDMGIKLHKVSRVDYPCLKSEPHIWTIASLATQVAKEEKLDLLHANYALPHALIAYLANKFLDAEGIKLPYVVTGHGSDIHTNGSKDVVNPMLQLALRESSALTYVSRDLQSIAEEKLGINKPSRVIPNFVDNKIFEPKNGYESRERMGIGLNDFVVGHVSNFAPVKQTMDFLDIASNMSKSNGLHDVKFLMIGDGPDRPILEDAVRRRGYQDNFIFRGERGRDEVVDSYSVMDVVVLTSKHEGNPLVLLEAMACGKPVLGYRVGGIEESIRDGTGFLVSPNDKSEMAASLLGLKSDKDVCKKMGEEGRSVVTKHFSPELIMSQYLDVFRGVVGK